MNLEKYSTSDNSEDIFLVDEIALENSRFLLNDENIEIEEASIQSSDLTLCVIIDIIEGEIRYCNSKIKLHPLRQMIGTWEIDADEFKDIKSHFH
ncbi:10236_t:CDS:2 [Scutellospora calospora]|uniref:10236_t:CDS:1 n=1 Tax=Scutellospora calospora TaxID=85575 RepID=A0ACA9KFQ7_9GLOM|nr:10236_t:CDS:2 [Scutellospora calospora]